MREADESGHLSALVTAVLACAAHDSTDVQEHAALTVASFWSGGGAADTLHAARAAVRAARRTVALASEAADWDLYGDLTEDITTDWQSADLHSTLSHWGTAPADLCAVTTPADIVDHAVTTVPGPRAVTLSRMVADYRAHDVDACERCHDGAGRRVSLTGITAHAEGWDGTDSRYHAARRHAVAALAAVDADRVLSELDGAPLASRPRHSRATGGDRTPRTVAPEPVLRVTARDGSVMVRNLTDAETVALATAGKRTAPARHAGEEYGVTTSPAPDGDRTLSGQVRSFKPVVSPRKKSGGNTGPTVPARLS